MKRLDAIRSKVNRAEEHLQHFKDLVLNRKGPIYPRQGVSLTYLPPSPYVELRDTALDPKQQVELGIVVADVIHQTRAALDHVVSAIGVANRFPTPLTDKERKNLSFPICDEPANFKADWRVSQKFFEPLLGVDVVQEIEACQPYNTQRDALWILKSLDDIDKHRTVLVGENRVTIALTAYSEGETLKHPFLVTIEGSSLSRDEAFPIGWPHSVPPRTVTLDEVTREFIFTEPVCDGENAFPLLRRLIRETRDTLGRFDRFLPN